MSIVVFDRVQNKLILSKNLAHFKITTGADGSASLTLPTNLTSINFIPVSRDEHYFVKLISYDPATGSTSIKVYKLQAVNVHVITGSSSVSVVSDVGSETWSADATGVLSHVHALTKTTLNNVSVTPEALYKLVEVVNTEVEIYVLYS
ncbi:MAG: hypothetical protein QXS19_05815 [Candidatus Methanomethylicia archaeon]